MTGKIKRRRITKEGKTKKAFSTLFLGFLLFSGLPGAFNSEEPECRVVLSNSCRTQPKYRNKEIESFIKKAIRESRDISDSELEKMDKKVRETIYPEEIYIIDMNLDNSPEYIVPLCCGATGNCTFIVVADGPPRIIGEIGAELIVFKPSKKGWPDITVYWHMGAGDGIVWRYTFKDGRYQEDPKVHYEVSDSYDGKIHTKTDFFKKIGPVKCECGKDSLKQRLEVDANCTDMTNECILRLIESKGAETALKQIFNDQDKWRCLLVNITCGNKDWLETAMKLEAVADAGMGEQLDLALGEALEHNAENVLRVTLPVLDIARICGAPDTDAPRYDSHGLSSKAILLRQEKVKCIEDPSLQERCNKCLEALEKAKSGIDKFYKVSPGYNK